MHRNSPWRIGLSVLALALTGATVSDSPAGAAIDSSPGAVYTQTNSASGNSILSYNRSALGILTFAGSTPTGGLGTGGGLGNQGALTLADGGRALLAVNAGSSDISALAVSPGGLSLINRVPSGGAMPVSITSRGKLVYVLNAGGVNNISAFTIGVNGALSPLPGSTRPLSAASTGPAQIEFSRDGRLLAVTEKATNKVVIFTVGNDGRASGPFVTDSHGSTPFGFGWGHRGELIVSEAFPGMANASAVSSYAASPSGNLTVVSGSSPTHQTAACWVVVTDNGKFAYAANAASGSISGYRILKDGSLELLDPSGVTAAIGNGSGPVDMALSAGSRFLYVVNRGHGTVGMYRVESDGGLTALGTVDGIPPTATGLTAR